jgi:hypothetical protein
VIENDIQNHFDARAVKCLHHFLELELLLPQTSRTAVGGFGRKENHRIISPVIPEWRAGLRMRERPRVFVELLHRHQFHGSHPQIFEIGNFSTSPRYVPGLLYA